MPVWLHTRDTAKFHGVRTALHPGLLYGWEGFTFMDTNHKNSLVVVWSSQDPDVALNTVFMYCKNSKLKGWWDFVKIVVWGPSARLLSENHKLQIELIEVKKTGVEIMACRACADRYGVSDKLEALGCQVIYMGEPLTAYLKGQAMVMAF